MTPDEIHQIKALMGCSFYPGNFDKRFVKQLAALPQTDKLSADHKKWLAILFYKYRHQHGKQTIKPQDYPFDKQKKRSTKDLQKLERWKESVK